MTTLPQHPLRINQRLENLLFVEYKENRRLYSPHGELNSQSLLVASEILDTKL